MESEFSHSVREPLEVASCFGLYAFAPEGGHHCAGCFFCAYLKDFVALHVAAAFLLDELLGDFSGHKEQRRSPCGLEDLESASDYEFVVGSVGDFGVVHGV